MSVATEFAPVVFIPERARTCPPPAQRLASVTALHRPAHNSVTAPVRLTRRGAAVVAVAVAVLALTLFAIAWLSAPGDAAGAPHATAETVTVEPGDSLWSIAGRVAPQRDPRAEVADLQRLNHLGGAALFPGQVLRTH